LKTLIKVGSSAEIDRLMLFLPPRQGKSELASKSYPAYTSERMMLRTWRPQSCANG
jgi:hypothetical protein